MAREVTGYYKPLGDNDLELIRENPDVVGNNFSFINIARQVEDNFCRVSFRPSFNKLRAILHKRNIVKGRAKISKIKFDKSRMAFALREAQVLSQLTRAHNDYEIVVGFLDDNQEHYSWDGKHSIKYLSLIKMLIALGYDPLLPIRSAKFKEKIGNKMSALIIDRINVRNINDGRLRIKEYLKPLARSIKDYVVEYIFSGVKPILMNSTINTREWRKKKDASLYKGAAGINEPLYETGQMAESVSFEILSSKDSERISKIIQEHKKGKDYKKVIDVNKTVKEINERSKTLKKIASGTASKSEVEKYFEQIDRERQAAERIASKKASANLYESEIRIIKSMKAKAREGASRGLPPPYYGLTTLEYQIYRRAVTFLKGKGIDITSIR